MVQRFKPCDVHSDQHPKAGQDVRNGRNESKKIMKKSASIQPSDVGCDIQGLELTKAVKKPKAIDLSDVDDLISLPHVANHAKEPGKPPPPSKVPNYMKPTRSSGAKKDSKQASVSNGVKSTNSETNQARKNFKNPNPNPKPSGRCLVKTSSLKLARNLTKSSSFKQTASVKKSISDTHVQRATCSSLLKDSKFPSNATLSAGASESRGASSMEVCSYKYCSLNGHHHAIAQPLKSFISYRRRSLRKQRSLKLKDDATRQVPFLEENGKKEGLDFFVDIYENFNHKSNLVPTGIEVDSDEEIYESRWWEAYKKEIQELEYIEAQLEKEVYIRIENEAEFRCISGSSFTGAVTVSENVAKICFEDELEGCCQEENESKNNNLERQNHVEIDETFSYMEDLVDKEMVSAEDENIAVHMEDKENAEDDQVENKCQESFKLDQNVFPCTAANGESEMEHSGIKITKCKRAEEDSNSEKGFNPQEPNYLPLEPVPKGEQVDLKHQDIDERKNSEEWMVDYALQKTVTKLAPVKRKKVELLVEAFESVAPVTKHEEHERRASFPFADVRTIQSCN